MIEFKKSRLENGVTVVTERHPFSRAVVTGVWIKSGSRDEGVRINGMSHLVEHLVFKGTKKRSAFDLACAMEAVGGDLNAFTTREYTCYHATSLKEDLALNLDVVSDLAAHAQFPVREFAREKRVVIQEIAMTQDNPEEFIFDLFLENVYQKGTLGLPIAGTPESVENITRQDVLRFYKNFYNSRNLIVSAVGDVDHEHIVELADKFLGKIKGTSQHLRRVAPEFTQFTKVVGREAEQVQVLFGMPASSFKDAHRFDAFIVNALLGGGMSSKLYQSVREKRGLAYSIYSQLMTFTDCGLFMIQGGTTQEHLRETIEIVRDEIVNLRKKKLRKKDLELFKTQVRGSILLGSDDIENRMNSIAVNEMVFGEYRSVEKVISEVDQVSVDSVFDFVKQYFNEEAVSLMVLGPVSDKDENWLSRN